MYKRIKKTILTALGFPVAVVGNKTLIPREGFLRWMEGRETDGYPA